MKNASTIFLQVIVILIGIAALAFLLVQPHFEGVNANATSWADIYLDDPLLAFAYVASIPFFIGLYQVFLLLGHAGKNTLFSQRSMKALRTIQYCAVTMVPFIIIGAEWILSVESDDRPPIIGMATISTSFFIVIAVAAGMAKRLLQNAVHVKTENELTV